MTDPELKGPERLKGEIKQKSSPLQLVADLFRLNLISDRILGSEPLSRGTRESHFAEAWAYAVGHYDEPDRDNCIRLDRYMALARRMRELSPHEEGKHIEVITRLLSPTPPQQLILGSPYDEPTEGPFSFITDRIGKDKKRH
nr:hypothetical protein [uncultured Methanoregula sp.]